MALAATAKPLSSTPPLRAFGIICDGGDAASVAVLHLPFPPAPGLRFAAFGRTWEVVRAASLVRGAVAKPAGRDESVAPWTMPSLAG